MNTKRFEKYPFPISELDEKSKTTLKSLNLNTEYVRVEPKKYLAPSNVATAGLNLLNLQARPNDIWLFGYPRSGTTLTQELLWLIKNDLDFDGAASQIMDHRFPYIDTIFYMDSTNWNEICEKSNAPSSAKSIGQKYSKPHYQALEESTENRFIKTHFPISLSTPTVFQVGCKVVYCARSPKDMIVSNYHFQKLFFPAEWENHSMEDFWICLKNNLFLNTPWFEHIKEGWVRRNDENFLFLFYEDIVRDMKGTILKIAKFLDKQLSDADVQKLQDHLNIDKFRKNKSVNNDHFIDLGIASNKKEHQFIRKGKIGGWKEYFSPELNAEVDKWIEKNLKNSDLKFPY